MKNSTKKIGLWFLDLIINIAIIFSLVLVIQTWIIAPFDVSGASMCDTLNFVDDQCQGSYGEKIIINEAGYLIGDPERGDVVVFSSPADEDKYYIKRVIGLPGDNVEIKAGEVYVNEIKLKEDYLNESNNGKTQSHFNFNVFDVPEGSYLLFGDNRKASTDSRTCFQGSISADCKKNPELAYVKRDLIRGKAWVVWWPVQNIRLMKDPEYPDL
jgi:signal peptidase I